MNLIKRQTSKLLEFDIIIGSHSKSTFNAEGGRGVLKKRTKMNSVRKGGSSLSVHSLCKKNCLIFQTAVFFLISCLAVAKSFCFEPNPAYKGGFLLKRRRRFFFHLTIFYEHVNIFIAIA